MKKTLTSQDLLHAAKTYLKTKGRSYTQVQESDDFEFIQNKTLIFGKNKGTAKDVFSVEYGAPWGIDDASFFLIIDAYTGEVYYTLTPHGFAEEWE